MAYPDRKRRIRWALWVVASLVLLGAGTLLYKDRQVSNEIRREEELLLAMGVDVRRVRSGDAMNDYYEVAEEMKDLGESEVAKKRILTRLEQAVQKPLIAIGSPPLPSSTKQPKARVLDHIVNWISAYASSAASRHDWSTLERLFGFEAALQKQMLSRQADGFDELSFGVPPLGGLARGDAQVRQWLRTRLESFDRLSLLKAQLSGMGRRARRPGTTSPGKPAASGLGSWWQTVVESQTWFQKSAELSVLRNWRMVVTSMLKKPVSRMGIGDCGLQLREGLMREGSWPAEWAANRLIDLANSSTTYQTWNVLLIEIDLQEQRETGKPLVPTWSKRYCFDPEIGAPIVVTATKTRLKMTSNSASTGWTLDTSW